jgi:4-hydroxybenzoyl-CoA reductase subunit alpha
MAPVDLGSYSSRVTFMAGNAAIKAGEAIRAKLIRAAAALTGKPETGFLCRDEQVVYAPEPSVRVSYMDALTKALAGNGALIAKGVYTDAVIPVPDRKGGAAGLAPSYSFQAYISEVTVDPGTGFITVEKVWAAHDCGRALNPLAVEGQIIGCIHMGLGQALQESFDYTRGHILNANLLDYRPISSKQMPPVEVFLVESNDPEGPFGAKEAGEGPLLPILPSVANAVYDAVGIRVRQLPMTPDRVFEAILKQSGKALRLPPRPTPVPA